MTTARRRATAALAFLSLTAACYEVPAGEQRTKEVVNDLVAREYGTASSRYRMFEAEILSPEAAPAWRRVIDHADATVREWAVDALSRIDMEDDLTLVQARLDDPVRGVRTAAVSGLIRMDRQAATAELARRLTLAAPEQVTLAAAGLVELGYTEGAALIVQRFTDPSLPESTRAALTQPLAALGGAVVIVPLVEAALDTEASVELRRLAAESAFAAEAPGMEDELRRLLGADDDYVRALAETMLGRVGQAG